MPVVYLSLGSNVGDRMENLRDACRKLNQKEIRIRKASSVYETEPVGFLEQAWFLNCAVEAETSLDPLALLREIKEIEKNLGRQRELPKGPRTLDIDILLYDDLLLTSREITLPHPEMTSRRFVLEPLAEIAPDLVAPGTAKTIREALAELKDPSEVRKIEGSLLDD
ncbi:MAG: 2-amino-4-hydroxy-6-hydroxymethyldihydropteridine diphosphokinase [Acidobacteria bacterium RIFCSPLOWO2_12_FULL_54_10]|nr:MAG: 2-amino-4-hydroxy-6-hydroxymethyldihydropteridine diphosphokinase [Acidobacteria bacterium RIFCSPLOWO2_12_FULL_54_10]